MNMPLVSIIMPSYNSSKFIEESIESVLKQTYTNWELLIVDDFSKDESVELISLYSKKDDRIKLFLLNENVGAANARNIALDNARGRYIAFLDSDDVWFPNKLEVQLNFMTTNQYPFTFSSYNIITEEGREVNKIINAPSLINYRQYLKNTIIGCLTVVLDKDVVGDFRMPLTRSSHDMALWLLIMKRDFVAYGLNEVLASHRLVSTSNTAKKWKAARDVWKVYRRIENLSVLYSLFCFLGYAWHATVKRI